MTRDFLLEVRRVAHEHPRKPTAAVQHYFGYTRVYSRTLITLSEELDDD